jgi:histidine triad (HIT) family protein
MDNCIFCRIAKGEVEKDFEYQDSDIVVFADIKPVAPVHLLLVPREHIRDFFDVPDPSLFSKIGSVAQKLIEKKELMGKGYRIVVNGGGAQIIDHLHFHLIGPIGHAAKL